MLRNLGFVWFWKHKDSVCSLNDSLGSLKICKWFLTKAYLRVLPSFDHPTSKSLSGVLGLDEHCEAHLPCICCQVKSQTAPEGSVILVDQNSASVWNIFGGNYTPLLDRISFSSFWIWDMAIFFFFFSWAFMCSTFFYILLGPSLCSLFSILWDLHVSHTFSFCIALMPLSGNMLERSYL
jgi:hypothetical protein